MIRRILHRISPFLEISLGTVCLLGDLLNSVTLLVELLLNLCLLGCKSSGRSSLAALSLRSAISRGRSLCMQCLFNHTDSFLLVTQSCKSAKSHIVRPVEPSVVLRVLYAFRPKVLSFDILSYP